MLPKTRYHVHKTQPLFHFQNQMSSFHNLPPYNYEICSNIILPPTFRTSKWSRPSCFWQHFCTNLTPVTFSTCPSHFVPLDVITRIILREAYRLRSSSLCCLLQPPAASSLLGTNILLSNSFWNTFNLFCSLHVRDKVSHPYKTTGKNVILYILILKFLERRW